MEKYLFYPADDRNVTSWNEARSVCQSQGADWDLVVFDKKSEKNLISGVIENECWTEAFWIGFTEAGGQLTSVFGEETEWDPTSAWSLTEPNDNMVLLFISRMCSLDPILVSRDF